METKSLKALIDKTGIAFLTLFNLRGESLFLGNVETMNNQHGRLNLAWKVPTAEHISDFTAYMIHDRAVVHKSEAIVPVRADMGLKRFEVELDY